MPIRPTIFIRSSQPDQMVDPLSATWNIATDNNQDNELINLLDFSQVNEVFESFLAVLGLPVAIIDLKGRVLASSRWQRLCLNFHRSHPDTLARCLESDTVLAQEMMDGKTFAMYRCHNGLTDCAAPIVLDGQHIANLFIGQFLLDTPDMAQFKAQQEAHGFAEQDYFTALSEIPIVSAQKLPDITRLMTGFANQIVALSMARKEALQARAEIEKQVEVRTHELEITLQQLKASEKKLAMLYQEAPVGLALNRLSDGRFVEGNPALYQITGHSAEEYTQLSYWDITPPEYEQQEMEQIEALKQTGRYGPYEKEYLHKDGHRVNVLLHGVQLDWADEDLIFSVVQDITDRKKNEQQIRQLAYYDTLTQLPNRRLFNDRLQQALATSHRTGRYCALMFLDLDNFKPLNDHYGHDVGDLLLIEVAQRLSGCTRKMDTVARFGGDEFIVLIRELNMDRQISTSHAGIVAEKIRQTLSEPYHLTLPHIEKDVQVVEHHCSASIGVLMFADHQDSPEDLLKWADMAMYQAKEKGGNTYHFYEPFSLLFSDAKLSLGSI